MRRHGVRGELRLFPFNPASPAILAATRLALCGSPPAPPQWVEVVGARPHKNLILVRLAGVDTAEAADALIGRTVAVRRDQLPDLDDGAVYHCDVIGCRVVTEGGEELGTVDAVMPTGSNDVLVVRQGGREILLPWIDDVVVQIDTSAALMVVRPLPGLLED